MVDRLELFNAVVNRLQDQGEEASVMPDYSGRGMYSATTPAIDTDANPILIGFTFKEVAEENGWQITGRDLPARRDNMGLGMVYYALAFLVAVGVCGGSAWAGNPPRDTRAILYHDSRPVVVFSDAIQCNGRLVVVAAEELADPTVTAPSWECKNADGSRPQMTGDNYNPTPGDFNFTVKRLPDKDVRGEYRQLK